MRIICTVINDLTYDQRMHRICGSLGRAGYEVVLVGRVLSHSTSFEPKLYSAKRLKCWINKGKFFYVEYNIRLFFYLLFTRFDVICSVDLDTILAGFMSSRLKGKVQVYDAHEYFTEVPEVVERPKIKRIWEAIANFTIPKMKYAYTVGEGLSNIFKERYGIAFKVIRNVPLSVENIEQSAYNTMYHKYKIEPTNKKILLYQGALNDGRGIEELILAVDKLDNVIVWLAGEGDLSAFLREIVRHRGLEKKVKFLGYVLPEDLKVITKMADIGINLLQNKGLNYYYSLANKCFDYIQADLPSIHVDFPEYRYINDTYKIGVLITDLEVKTITVAIKKLINDQEFYNEIVENCKNAKRVLTWRQEEKKLLQIYSEIASEVKQG